jgi:hypothetical protein
LFERVETVVGEADEGDMQIGGNLFEERSGWNERFDAMTKF